MFTRCGKRWNGLGTPAKVADPKSKNASSALAVFGKPTELPRTTYTLEVTNCQGPKWENGMTYGEDGKPSFPRQTEFRR
jgi:hypothetical protein